MNREIKFRVWNGEQMVSPDYIDREGVAHWKENSIPSVSYQIMQYTGLKDKNGNEIYQGDHLFVSPGYSSIVKFEYGMFVSVYSHPEDGETLPLCDVIGKDTVVIGNVYETPELKK